MSSEILVAILSCIGTLIGSLGGVLASSKLTSWRLRQLEEKVNKHNTIIERTYKLEALTEEHSNEINSIRDYIEREEAK